MTECYLILNVAGCCGHYQDKLLQAYAIDVQHIVQAVSCAGQSSLFMLGTR